MKFNSKIKVSNKFIGENHPCFIVAEIGINHNGDIDLAKKTIRAAFDSGADAVKFQNYITEDFILDETLSYTYTSQGKEVTETQWELFRRCELSNKQLYELNDYCKEIGILFLSTPTSKEGIDVLKELEVCLIKNGSDFLTNLELINQMSHTNIPIVLSTGMATLAEIDDAVEVVKESGNPNLVLLHCTSNYPTKFCDINLNKIPTLSKTFGCLSGFSDHSVGITAAIGAKTLGASFIEKHFTLDRNLAGPDHHLSSDPEEFSKLVNGVRAVEVAMGDCNLGLNASEKSSRKDFRLSCIANENLKAGIKIEEKHISFGRPGTGIPPKNKTYLINKILKNDVKKGKPIYLDDL